MDEMFTSPVVNESIKKGGNDLSDKNPLPVEKDNAVKGGFKKSLNDLACSVIDNNEDEEDDSDKAEDDEDTDEDGKKKWTPPWKKDNNEEDEEQIQESTKIMKKTLNKGMAKKSIFDTLYAK